jgi:predicted lipoprotein with Yx(FWY)xxD motif
VIPVFLPSVPLAENRSGTAAKNVIRSELAQEREAMSTRRSKMHKGQRAGGTPTVGGAGVTHFRQAAAIAMAVGTIGGLSLTSVAAGAGTVRTSKSVVVSTEKNAKLGTILVSGNALYTLKASKAGCTGSCAQAWPELVLPKGVKSATAGKGVTASKLGAVSRAGGVHQVTYNGQPLYHFVGDKSAVQVNGNGVKDSGGTWSAVVTAKLASSTPTTSTATAGGYGY